MASFPKLKTGSLAQFPLAASIHTQSSVMRFVDGSEQRFARLARPLQRWVVQLHQLDSVELTKLEQFWESVQGSYGSFEFTDPISGTTYTNCSFDADQSESLFASPNVCRRTLTIRENRT